MPYCRSPSKHGAHFRITQNANAKAQSPPAPRWLPERRGCPIVRYVIYLKRIAQGRTLYRDNEKCGQPRPSLCASRAPPPIDSEIVASVGAWALTLAAGWHASLRCVIRHRQREYVAPHHLYSVIPRKSNLMICPLPSCPVLVVCAPVLIPWSTKLRRLR